MKWKASPFFNHFIQLPHKHTNKDRVIKVIMTIKIDKEIRGFFERCFIINLGYKEGLEMQSLMQIRIHIIYGSGAISDFTILSVSSNCNENSRYYVKLRHFTVLSKFEFGHHTFQRKFEIREIEISLYSSLFLCNKNLKRSG